MKVTAVLFVERVEPSLVFWVGRMGWTSIAEVPHGDAVGFAILQKDGAELMFQSWASADADHVSADFNARASRSAIFIEVDDFDDVIRRTQDLKPSMPQRDTFYGMREIGFIEPGGHSIVFGKQIAAG